MSVLRVLIGLGLVLGASFVLPSAVLAFDPKVRTPGLADDRPEPLSPSASGPSSISRTLVRERRRSVSRQRLTSTRVAQASNRSGCRSAGSSRQIATRASCTASRASASWPRMAAAVRIIEPNLASAIAVNASTSPSRARRMSAGSTRLPSRRATSSEQRRPTAVRSFSVAPFAEDCHPSSPDAGYVNPARRNQASS